MSTWYAQLGFVTNPLDARPNPLLIGLESEEEQLKNHIFKEEICFLNGLTGSGKTSLLTKIQKEMTDHTFVYLDADALPKTFNLMEALKDKRSFLDRLTFKQFPKKKPVLIIDEFQATDPTLILEARSNWENPGERKIKSIVIAQISDKLRNVTGSFKDRLGNRSITLKQLDDEDMKRILNIRLKTKDTNYVERISDEALELLVRVADGNARRLLEYTDLVFDFHFRRFGDINPIARKKEYVVTYYATKEILEVNNIYVEGYEHMGDTERSSVPFDKAFKLIEQNALMSLNREGAMTSEELASHLHLPLTKCQDLIKELRKKEAIVTAERSGKKLKWQLTPRVKRMMVKK